MNLDRLRTLVAVAEFGSIAAAASALRVTPSAVSQQLAKLDHEAGIRLTEPDGRGIRLTDGALVLAQHAVRILGQVEAAQAELAALRGDVRGRLVLAAFASAARGIAPPALRTLRDRYPELSVELRELENDASVPAVGRGDIDVALVNEWGPVPLDLPRQVEVRTIARDAFDVIVPVGHPLAGAHAVELGQLKDEPWIGWTKGSSYDNWLVQTLRATGATPVIAHNVEEHHTHAALVAAGLGVAMLPRIGRPEHRADGVAVPVRPNLTRRVRAIWRRASAARPAVRAVVKALSEATQLRR
jgi:DNA-binding transcriptional LysR family regulator